MTEKTFKAITTLVRLTNWNDEDEARLTLQILRDVAEHVDQRPRDALVFVDWPKPF